MASLSEQDIILANKIADRIKNLRIQITGAKQMDFVIRFNVEKQNISRWESHIKINKKTGEPKGRGITIYTIQKFCNIIGISLSDFFDDPIFKND
ncbi:XRE family transcriptional regulator [Muricauda ruestringensis]|uniref:XRE family transcriptional regulator n=1 Tax=Flagellimonas aurea TaxID=2915619 RepID=A0ABS3G5L2_9FLAO|nr:XRE family transcriptional regulator [Allomuricauda aurea]MAO18628.1 transcriptional regulator [Allomuricauda sp.]MBO0354710.1 XRE family transcriptional regulator [Allomuricauda aurea]|tara:strand:- start:604 stop:888 length:285 start_codon:yes stop_codon:yes gene_type:complete